MKILFFTDSHIRGNNPANRKDDFVLALENKFREIVRIVDEKDIDYVLHGGDIFERPDIALSVVNKFIKILSEINVPIHLISGNHDIYGQNPNTINRTVLSLLDTVGSLNLISSEDKIILEKDGLRVQLTGQPYVYDIDTGDRLEHYSPREKDEDVDYAIHMVHGMLLDKPFIKGINYSLIDDIKDTKADIVLSGHYHSGFGAIELEGKYFINPGSIVRVSNSMLEMARRPKVIVLDLSKDAISIEEINLKSAAPGEEVLDRKKLEEASFKNERIIEFKQSIDSALNFDKLDINDVIIEFSTSNNIEKKVLEEALRRIAEVEMKGLNL